MPWNEIAFSHQQIAEFLSLVALPHYEAAKLLPFDSVAYRCFCTGFYFFVWGIREELSPQMSGELLPLAVRVEALALHLSKALWDQNSQDACLMLARYFGAQPIPLA